jgi:hypothetical protein
MSTSTQAFIDRLLDIVATRDHARIDEIIGDPITFYTPRFLKPHTDRATIKRILQGIPVVVENFHYERTWAAGREAILEFKGNVGAIQIHGLDIFTVGDDGRASELTVFIRPAKGLQALGEAEDKMTEYFGKAPAKPGA